ncbi:transmembrane protein 59-like [Ascaphus truei]|uniref:transmembrane protein 59-like n=1 Tax=Ascaphus truei TaxID=8439 RepID=UPI003F5A883D
MYINPSMMGAPEHWNCHLSLLLSLILIVCAVSAADPLDTQLGDINSCKKQCQLIFKHKSSAEDAVLGACYRGCRLFSICHFVDGTAELNATRVECESACVEAYAKADEQYGCTTGCRKQLPEVENQREKMLDLRPPAFFSVFDLISSFCSDIVSSAQSFISSTWTFYLQADDGKVVVFQSQPEMEFPVLELQAPRSDVTEKAWLSSRFNTLMPHTGLRDKIEKPPGKDSKVKHKLPHLETAQPEHDFLGCMSKRSGLPRWILAACLFLSIMVMLWLSCASLVTAPDQHIKAQPLSINGDKEYLEDMEKPAPFSLQPVVAVTICPTEESEEAGPLPVKVDLDKTII